MDAIEKLLTRGVDTVFPTKEELKKVLKLAGIKDVYTKTFGSKRTTFNLIKACMDALEKTNRIK